MELFSIKIRCTFQLVSTVYMVLTNNIIAFSFWKFLLKIDYVYG